MRKEGKGAYLYDVRSGGGEGGPPKSRQKEQGCMNSVCERGEGAKKSENFADAISIASNGNVRVG